MTGSATCGGAFLLRFVDGRGEDFGDTGLDAFAGLVGGGAVVDGARGSGFEESQAAGLFCFVHPAMVTDPAVACNYIPPVVWS